MVHTSGVIAMPGVVVGGFSSRIVCTFFFSASIARILSNLFASTSTPVTFWNLSRFRCEASRSRSSLVLACCATASCCAPALAPRGIADTMSGTRPASAERRPIDEPFSVIFGAKSRGATTAQPGAATRANAQLAKTASMPNLPDRQRSAEFNQGSMNGWFNIFFR